MTRRGDRSGGSAEPYSPHRRTAVLFAGVGTAGAYHAGALRALHEAGVKIDVAAGRGVGAVTALFTAVDGGSRLWAANGLWQSPAVAHLYPWHPWLRLFARALTVAFLLVAAPLAIMALGLVVYPLDFVLKMIGQSGGGLTAAYLRAADVVFAPSGFPTWLPRLAVLALATAVALAAAAAVVRTVRRRERGPVWWRLVPAPLSAEQMVAHCWSVLWDLVRGAANVRPPAPQELATRYADLLAENLGQPGFRELVIAVHDIDARRDLICAVVADPRRRMLTHRSTAADEDQRYAEVLDLAGVARDKLADVVTAALTVPLATDWHAMTFARDSYWRGETHRVGDRPGSLRRLVSELVGLDVEQVIIVSAAPASADPHELATVRRDGRGRIGEQVQADEAAAIADVVHGLRPGNVRLFVIRPAHNPIGPFDFTGGFDDRSDRARPLGELLATGYEDAFRQFVEPVVAPSGDRVGQPR